MSEYRAVPPGKWTAAGSGLEVRHESLGARTIELFEDGRVHFLEGEWIVRPVFGPVKAARAGDTARATTRAGDPFGQPDSESLRRAASPIGSYGPVFSAAFPGSSCADCTNDIEIDDPVRMGPDGIVHAECVEPDDGTSYADGIPS